MEDTVGSFWNEEQISDDDEIIESEENKESYMEDENEKSIGEKGKKPVSAVCFYIRDHLTPFSKVINAVTLSFSCFCIELFKMIAQRYGTFYY